MSGGGGVFTGERKMHARGHFRELTVGFQAADPGIAGIHSCLEGWGGQTTRAHTDNMKTGKTLRRTSPL